MPVVDAVLEHGKGTLQGAGGKDEWGEAAAGSRLGSH